MIWLIILLVMVGAWAALRPLARTVASAPHAAAHHRLLPAWLGFSAALAMAGLAVMTWFMAAGAGGFAAQDAWIRDVTAWLREGMAVHVILWITRLGDSATLTAVALVATGYLLAAGRRPELCGLWVTILGAHITTWTGKFLIARPRPEFLTQASALSPSFPSLHATGAMAVLAFVAWTLARATPRDSVRYDVAFGVILVIGWVALSRVVLSVHYATDVVAGLLVGWIWLAVGVALTRWRERGTPDQIDSSSR